MMEDKKNPWKMFTIQRNVISCVIAAQVTCTEHGISVLVAGGDRSHIGAISIVNGKGQRETIIFEGHRDDTISNRWADRLYEASQVPVVVSVGIHYDDATGPQIREIVAACEEMLADILDMLEENRTV